MLILVLQERYKSAKASRQGSALPPPHVWIQPPTTTTVQPDCMDWPRGSSSHESSPSWETVPSQGCSSSSFPFRACGETPATESRQQWWKREFIPSLASQQFIAALVVIQGPSPSPCPVPRRGQRGPGTAKWSAGWSLEGC